MQMITRKKPAFTDLYQTGVLTRIVAVRNADSGGWRLFGLWRDKQIGVYVEAARGGVRNGPVWITWLTSAVVAESVVGRFTARSSQRHLSKFSMQYNPLLRVSFINPDKN